tara:strand:- start:640 stop:783 length:144 start_codon:yes stop_codon:yes gene_type:complete
MLKPSMANRFVAWWTSSAVGFPANPSHVQQEKKEKLTKTQGTCSPRS